MASRSEDSRATARPRPTAGMRAALTAPLLLVLALSSAAGEFVDVTAAAGLASLTDSRGAAWGDWDADGCIDLFVSGTTNTLYRNDCDGTFSIVSSGIGPPAGRGTIWADYDADGDLDLYVASEESRNRLYRNDGGGSFINVAGPAGIDDVRGTYGASWSDYDGDSDLDLFLANRLNNAQTTDLTDRLYRNNGDGTFTDVGPDLGVAGSSTRRSFMGVWFDYDDNGTQDLWVSVDFGDDVLYRNNGDGTFTDVSADAGVTVPQHGMGIAIGDPNNDGCPDVLITNNTQQPDPPHDASPLYFNNCDGTFTNQADAAGILDRGVVEWGANFVDFDNDGDEDLSIVAGGMLSDGEPNILYENDGTGFMSDVTVLEQAENDLAGFGSAWADFDNDGDLDWLVINEGGANALLRNDLPGSMSAAHLRVRLNGVISNPDGIGAAISIRHSQGQALRVLQAGDSYLSSHELVATFGTGGSAVVDRINVTWPSGVRDRVAAQPVGQEVLITEGEGIVNGATIEGTTLDPQGVPLGAVRVRVFTADRQLVKSTTSDAAGNYLIPRLLPGSYFVAPFKAGFAMGQPQAVDLSLNEVVTLDLQLRDR